MVTYKLKSETCNIVIVFMLLFLSSSFIVTNNIISNSLTIGLWISLVIITLLSRNIRINPFLLYSALIISVLMFVTDFLCGEDLMPTFKNVFSIVVVFLIASGMSFANFSIAYVKIMKFLCGVSLTGYFLHMIVPGVFNVFTSTYGNGTPFSNWIIYIQYLGNSSSLYRNFGFTWEPGAFVTFICLAMLLDVYVVSKQINFKTIILYCITTVTTFSTTGIIAMLCLCLYITFINKQIRKSVKYAVAITLLLLVVFLIVFSDMFFSTANYSTFGKLILFFESGGKLGSSVGARFHAITKVFQAFLKSPIIGWGYEGLIRETYEYTKGIITCTFANWFGLYGVIFGSIMWSNMYLLSKRISFGGINRFVVFLFLFGITSTENYARNAFFIILAFYGILEWQTNRKAHKNPESQMCIAEK